MYISSLLAASVTQFPEYRTRQKHYVKFSKTENSWNEQDGNLVEKQLAENTPTKSSCKLQ